MALENFASARKVDRVDIERTVPHGSNDQTYSIELLAW